MLIFSKLVSNYASSSQILFFFLSWEYTIGDRYRELDWLGVAAGVSAAGRGHRVRWSIREFATPVSSVTGSLTPSIPPLSPPPPGPGPTLLHRKPLQAAHRKCTFTIPGYLPAARPSLIGLAFSNNYSVSKSLIYQSQYFPKFIPIYLESSKWLLTNFKLIIDLAERSKKLLQDIL